MFTVNINASDKYLGDVISQKNKQIDLLFGGLIKTQIKYTIK